MEEVRVGIIGFGGMGRSHAGYLSKGEVKGAKLVAVCDAFEASREAAKTMLGESVRVFDDAEKLMTSGAVDAVIIATPHYDHPPLVIAALKHNLHALTEKPAGVYTRQVREMNEAAANSDRVFGIMYNQRTKPHHQKMKQIIESGQLGEIRRVMYVVTDWFRTQAYYDSGGWRATWGGEGGGVLINQSPHNLDLWQWICGMPVRMRAFCGFGTAHDIEVEDAVTAYAEYENGATGVFISTTGEAPGTNRFEIAGDYGKLLLEGGKLTWYKNRENAVEFSKTAKGGFETPEVWKIEIPGGSGEAHKTVTQNWIGAIRGENELMIPGEEGIKGLSLSNAMHLSTWTDDWVEFPLDEEAYLSELTKRIENSTVNKKTGGEALNFGGTF